MNKRTAIYCNGGTDVFDADSVVAVSKAQTGLHSRSVLVFLRGSRTIEVLDMEFDEVMDLILDTEE